MRLANLRLGLGGLMRALRRIGGKAGSISGAVRVRGEAEIYPRIGAVFASVEDPVRV
jgi:hypothetical protein